jgi:hypothetical protein
MESLLPVPPAQAFVDEDYSNNGTAGSPWDMLQSDDDTDIVVWHLPKWHRQKYTQVTMFRVVITIHLFLKKYRVLMYPRQQCEPQAKHRGLKGFVIFFFDDSKVVWVCDEIPPP